VLFSKIWSRPLNLVALLVLCQFLAAAQEVALTLASGEGARGTTVNLDLSVDTTGNTLPAAVQWTIEYSTDDIAAVEIAAGPAALFAEKIVVCNPSPGSIICLAYGLNLNPILNGVVATVQVTLAATTTNTLTELKLIGGGAAEPMGSALTTTTLGAQITVLEGQGGLPIPEGQVDRLHRREEETVYALRGRGRAAPSRHRPTIVVFAVPGRTLIRSPHLR